MLPADCVRFRRLRVALSTFTGSSGMVSVAVALSSVKVPTYVFDALTTPKPAREESCSEIVRGGVGQTPPSAFVISTLSLDREFYTWGDEAITELLVVNRGSAPVLFPWSIERPLCDDSQRRGFLPPHAAVVLELGDAGGTHAFIVPLVLFYSAPGSPSVDVTVRRGESVRLRVPAGLHGGSAPHFVLTAMPTPVTVQARLTFNLDPERYMIARTDLSPAVNVWLRAAK